MKKVPFSPVEGKVLTIARCIQEARDWGYPIFSESGKIDRDRIWISRKDYRTAIVREGCDDFKAYETTLHPSNLRMGREFSIAIR